MKQLLMLLLIIVTTLISCSQNTEKEYELYIKSHYTKIERMIPMRDGISLFTAIYIPNDSTSKHPILMERTPYSSAPYGENNLNTRRLGPNKLFAKEQYIFVYQDVRGRYKSEGDFKETTPAIDNKFSDSVVDESSDCYDTVEWLLKNIRNNNGNVGIYGISYPGFYAAASLPNAHPAIKAVSPQAPVTDEFEGDDAYHRGAFFLMDNFGFMNFFDHPRKSPWEEYPQINDSIKIEDAFDFYLKAGALKNFNTLYFHDESKIWNEYLAHAIKDTYWQERNLRPHLKNIQPAVLTVGGWFDAEDMFGALKTYEAIEQLNAVNKSRLVMGPWTHGAWESKDWSEFAGYSFNSNTSLFFQKMELDFFNFYLKGKGSFKAAEATVFITGSNNWKSFQQWPPKETIPAKWLLNQNHQLLLTDGTAQGEDSYISDPANPVPYINKKSDGRLNEYMAADQTFAAQRKDVLFYETDLLKENITLCGPVKATLYASLSSTDADFVVKIIDVLPDGSHTQQLVRAEILRGKFRNSFENPEPFVPGAITPVQLVLNDVAHTFLKGHKIMIQIQSSWFPLVDRNPQQFMNIPDADDEDFIKSTISIFHDQQHPSSIEVLTLKP